MPVWTQSAWRRPALAISLAILVNAGLLSAVLLTRPPATPTPLRALNVTLIEIPPEPDIEPEPVLEPIAEPNPPVEPESVAPPPAPQAPPTDAPQAQAPVSARSVDEAPTSPITDGLDIYAVSPGTRSLLSGMQCPGAPEEFARTGHCPEAATRAANLVAPEESAADHFALDVNALRADWGLGPSILEGENTLADPNARRTLSSSDQMRDVLPPSRPDPAFGD